MAIRNFEKLSIFFRARLTDSNWGGDDTRHREVIVTGHHDGDDAMPSVFSRIEYLTARDIDISSLREAAEGHIPDDGVVIDALSESGGNDDTVIMVRIQVERYLYIDVPRIASIRDCTESNNRLR